MYRFQNIAGDENAPETPWRLTGESAASDGNMVVGPRRAEGTVAYGIISALNASGRLSPCVSARSLAMYCLCRNSIPHPLLKVT
jgi:hypothetical protein